MAEVQINMQYPRNPDYDFVTKLVRLNLDLERENDIKNGKGFIIKDASNVKKEIKLQQLIPLAVYLHSP